MCKLVTFGDIWSPANAADHHSGTAQRGLNALLGKDGGLGERESDEEVAVGCHHSAGCRHRGALACVVSVCVS